MSDPLWYRYNGAVMVPTRRDLADQQFRVDGMYLLEAHHERSYVRHKAYFAALNEAWMHLDHDEWPSVERLRKTALIRTGWRDERTLLCGSHEQAEQLAMFCQPLDEFAIFYADGPLLYQWVAKSQSYRAMGRDPFNQSMDDVLDYVAKLVGVTGEVMRAQGGYDDAAHADVDRPSGRQ